MWYTVKDDMNTVCVNIAEIRELCLDRGIQKGTTIQVYGWEREELDIDNQATAVLDYLLECLDDAYSDPDGSSTVPTEIMKDAAKEFMKVIAKEYDVWTVEKVCEEDVVL